MKKEGKIQKLGPCLPVAPHSAARPLASLDGSSPLSFSFLSDSYPTSFLKGAYLGDSDRKRTAGEHVPHSQKKKNDRQRRRKKKRKEERRLLQKKKGKKEMKQKTILKKK